jgi:hypothetical protein
MSGTMIGLLAAVFVTTGVLLDRLWRKFGDRGNVLGEPTNPLPTEMPGLSDAERAWLELIQKEWVAILQVQMHFNDLVIRFRAMTLTTFGAFVGAAVAIGQMAGLSEGDRKIVLTLPVAFWIAAGVLDLGYYHRLLMGAVAQALKFDDRPRLKDLGLFGLTANIRNTVRPFTARVLVILYYLVPLVSVGGLVLWRVGAGSAAGSAASPP